MIFFSEGGRLEAELKYTAQALGEADSSTHQLVIQTAKDPDVSLLHAGALLEHLKVSSRFDLFSISKDVHYSSSF